MRTQSILLTKPPESVDGDRLVLLPSDAVIGHLEDFNIWMAAWDAAETTRRDRVTVIRAGLREWGCARVVTTDELRRWLAQYSGWTAVTYFGALRSYFGWLVEAGYREDDPTAGLRRPRSPKSVPRPLTPDEARRALIMASGHVRTWLLLGMFAGLRAHEVAKVRGEDVTAQGLYVVGKGAKAATIPTHPVIWEAAQHYQRRGFWFPSTTYGRSHVRATSVTARTSALFSALGIEGSHHRCRHYFGTQLLRSGTDIRVVQELMRHESLATTAGYLLVEDEQRVAAIRGMVA